jgi:hypothetical protein
VLPLQELLPSFNLAERDEQPQERPLVQLKTRGERGQDGKQEAKSAQRLHISCGYPGIALPEKGKSRGEIENGKDPIAIEDAEVTDIGEIEKGAVSG